MGINAYLVAPAAAVAIDLGKIIRNDNGTVVGFGLGEEWSWNVDGGALGRAIWRMLSESVGRQLIAMDERQFESWHSAQEAGGIKVRIIDIEGGPLVWQSAREYASSIKGRSDPG